MLLRGADKGMWYCTLPNFMYMSTHQLLVLMSQMRRIAIVVSIRDRYFLSAVEPSTLRYVTTCCPGDEEKTLAL